MTVVQDLGLWFWRLLPANPILLRVVSAASKRTRHLWARIAYLAALFGVIFIADMNLLDTQGTSLADLAKQSSGTFMIVSVVQLLLASFIAPIFAAGAITQEKDANTFHILLTTPLSDAQIVLGMLCSRLFFVWALLLSGVPVFCITMIFGGVTGSEVFQSVGLAATTGLVTGALAITIGVARVGTRRTILTFFVGVALYLLGVWALGLTDWGQLAEAPVSTATMGALSGKKMSWLAPAHPFLALFVVTGQTPAPTSDELGRFSAIPRWLLAHPAPGYMLLTSLLSLAWVALSHFFVRRGSKEGERAFATRIAGFFRGPAGERTRRPRHVWSNPIAWREANTRASAGGRSLLRWFGIGVGVLAGLLLLIAHEQAWGAGLSPAAPTAVRAWLVSLLWIEFTLILLVVANTAASTLTREKESSTMELLLTTPLTSQYIVLGMLRGLVSFALPLIAVPTSTIFLFALSDLFRGGDASVTTIEALVLAPVVMTALAAVAAMVGLHFSLHGKKTVQASMYSTAVVLGLAGLLFGCGETVSRAGGSVGAFFLPISPLHALRLAVHHAGAFAGTPGAPGVDELFNARIVRLFSTLGVAALYALLTRQLYAAMVRDFDMTVRRQSV